MASRLKSVTTSTAIRPCRMILLGVEKIGKSTFASQADGVVIIPIRREEGIDALSVPKLPVVNSFDELMETLQELAEEDHKYKTVVLDSASTFETLVFEKVCEEFEVDSIEKVLGGFGKGFSEAIKKWQMVMDALDFLRDEKNMASIIVGHVKIKRFDDPERESYDRYIFDINEKASDALLRWADFIGFAKKSIAIKKEKLGFNKEKKIAEMTDDGKPFLYTKKTAAHPGGGRFPWGNISDEIPLEWSEFKNAVDEVIKSSKPSSKAKA